MIIERVFLGDGSAIELRGPGSEICALLYLLVCAVDEHTKVIVPTTTLDIAGFIAECYCILNGKIDKRYRWLLFCTDVEFFTKDAAKTFQEKYDSIFGRQKISEDTDSPPIDRGQAIREVGLETRHRTWMIDRETQRYFCVPMDFSAPIYRTTLLAGIMMRHPVYQASTDSANRKTQKPNIVDSKTKMLNRLQQLLSDESGMPEQSPTTYVTEFIIYDAAMWCGDPTIKSEWLLQQLNVWFNTPEQIWYRPRNAVCLFRVALLDEEFTSQDTSKDVSKLTPLVAQTKMNTLLRYPKGLTGIVNVPAIANGNVSIGHFLPLFTADGSDWTSVHKLMDVRIFRIYKTQYPFIYTLMPDDDERVRELKSKLKTSTELNPTIGEKGLTLTQKSVSVRYAPLVLTLPTFECDRYVRAVFRQTPKYQYRIFYCARYDTIAGKSIWIPICAVPANSSIVKI